MDRISSLSRFKGVCPYLGRTKSRTIRTLSTVASTRYPSLSRLAAKATKCPVMGPALSLRSNQIANSYASVAGQTSGASSTDPEVLRLHERQGVSMAGADVAMCPHAGAARQAARVAEELAAARKKAALHPAPKKDTAAAAKCPFHAQADKPATAAPKEERKTKSKVGFDYEKFYNVELDKKHNDASYRYFNNINRLAGKFPVAHTGELSDEVEVWCANDYLGMGNNPVVLETMQCVSDSSMQSSCTLNSSVIAGLSTSTGTVPEARVISPETPRGTWGSRPNSLPFIARTPHSSSRHAMSRTMPRSRPSVPSSPAACSSPTR